MTSPNPHIDQEVLKEQLKTVARIHDAGKTWENHALRQQLHQIDADLMSKDQQRTHAAINRLKKLSVTFLGKQCIACTEKVEAKDFVGGRCGHGYCRGCVTQLVKHAVQSKSRCQLQCCNIALHREKALALVDPALAKAYRDKQAEFEDTRPTYCSKPTCSAYLDAKSKKKNIATCSSCQTRTCLLCQTAAHTGDCPVKEDEQQVRALAAEKRWQTCPGCKNVLEKKEGCSHMTCGCGTQFCYECGKLWPTCSCEPRWDRAWIPPPPPGWTNLPQTAVVVPGLRVPGGRQGAAHRLVNPTDMLGGPAQQLEHDLREDLRQADRWVRQARREFEREEREQARLEDRRPLFLAGHRETAAETPARANVANHRLPTAVESARRALEAEYRVESAHGPRPRQSHHRGGPAVITHRAAIEVIRPDGTAQRVDLGGLPSGHTARLPYVIDPFSLNQSPVNMMKMMARQPVPQRAQPARKERAPPPYTETAAPAGAVPGRLDRDYEQRVVARSLQIKAQLDAMRGL